MPGFASLGVVRDLRASRRMPGVGRILLPAKRVAYARDGISIAAERMRNLNQLAAKLGIAGLAQFRALCRSAAWPAVE